jgi:hypothetical protein
LKDAPVCNAQPAKKQVKKSNSKRSRKEESSLPQHGYKKKTVALSHSFGSVACPLCSKRKLFNLPERAAQMEQHILKHLKEPPYASGPVNVSNAVRVRIVVEDLFPSHLLDYEVNK